MPPRAVGVGRGLAVLHGHVPLVADALLLLPLLPFALPRLAVQAGAPLVEPPLRPRVHEDGVREVGRAVERRDHLEPLVEARLEPLRLRVVGDRRDRAAPLEVVHRHAVRVGRRAHVKRERADGHVRLAVVQARGHLRVLARVLGRIRAVPRRAHRHAPLEHPVRLGSRSQRARDPGDRAPPVEQQVGVRWEAHPIEAVGPERVAVREMSICVAGYRTGAIRLYPLLRLRAICRTDGP